MKSVIQKIKSEQCRIHEITEEEQKSFYKYSHLRRYYPALDKFNIPAHITSHKNIELPTQYQITEWQEQDTKKPLFWKALRYNTVTNQSESCRVFTKIVHLLNPIDMIKETYTCPEHPLLPQSENTWKNTLHTLHNHHNQAYVDAIANYILSRFRELDLTPHCVLSYSSYTGISESYRYNISNEYESYRQCRWFWKGLKTNQARLTIINNMEIKDQESYMKFYDEITKCPFTTDEDTELDELDILDVSDTDSIYSFNFDSIEEENKQRDKLEETDLKELEETDVEDVEDLEESEKSEESEDEFDMDICLEIPNMPIIIISQEAHEGVIDLLLDEDELDGYERGSQGWEGRWIAWLFQIISVLTFLQSTICFTHNDLHTNNIVWRKTEMKHLYYKIKDGTIWRVPTFGKILSIIDFGRSIFRLGKQLWVSDDHFPENDAGDQYNFGPFYDHHKPKCEPNPSFDLSRLSVSLIDGLYEEVPAKKKGKNIPILSEDKDWIVYETKSPLYNLLWSWTVDDAGKSVYEDKDGNERYDGFELYIHIAHDVHHAIPREQLHKPIFKSFIWKNKVPEKETVYLLGI